MERCVNFREGCQGRTSSYKIHYCNDCYNAWQVGGATQVSEDIAARNKPAHACVGAEQLFALEMFRHRVLESVRLTLAPSESIELTDERAVEIIRSRLRGTRVHPSAGTVVEHTKPKQLDRIESLAKQAASRSVFGPCFLTFVSTLSLVGGYFIW